MVTNKMIFGALITLIGLLFSGFSIIYAAMNPWDWNGKTGLAGSLIGTHMWGLLFLAIVVMICGLVICFKEAYPNVKIW
jgi:hypothetical protein